MKEILVILKEPFLDRIPSLKTLLLYFCDNDCKVTLVTSRSNRFSGLSTSHANLTVCSINERTQKIEAPTTIKLILKVASILVCKHYDLIIGGDTWGNIIASKLNFLYSCPHMFFALEFPQIVTEQHPVLLKHEILENKALQKADFIITHDQFHEKFICDNFNVENKKILKLANASFTPEFTEKSDFIRENFNIPADKIIVLHSGGFGVWFKCSELAEASKNWNATKQLIYHIGRKPSGTKEFDYIYGNPVYSNICFSLSPLSNENLDKMIASADVGIALYSVKALGYRAELMGLAAGKIGNYLKCGLPVIASRMPSLSYIEDFGCGILVDSENEIESAIDKIMADRESYRENAFRCYRELWHPSNYLPSIAQKLYILR